MSFPAGRGQGGIGSAPFTAMARRWDPQQGYRVCGTAGPLIVAAAVGPRCPVNQRTGKFVYRIKEVCVMERSARLPDVLSRPAALDGSCRSPSSGGLRSTWPSKGLGDRNAAAVMSIANDVERDIVEYLYAHFGVEADEITDESTLADLGLDSLGVLAIADILETKYGISLDDERIAGVCTYSDFKNFIFLKSAKWPIAHQSR
jgi:acyl carrier protein